jgi:uroporphyrinogen-III synthase
MLRVVVTRPAAQAATWVQSLAAHGIDAVAVPLIGIAPPDDPAAVDAAWRGLARQRLAVFVSPNAAQAFFERRPADVAWPAATLAAAVGPGTTQALRALGVPAIVEPARDSAQFDSEALWRRLSIEDWTGARVLLVRGDGGREWLADMLRDRGAQVHHVAAYRRIAPRLADDTLRALEAAVARPEEHVWLFSSSEAIGHLVAARPGPWHAARAVATHPRIAERARACGFGAVYASRPTLEAVVACIQSLAS